MNNNIFLKTSIIGILSAFMLTGCGSSNDDLIDGSAKEFAKGKEEIHYIDPKIQDDNSKTLDKMIDDFVADRETPTPIVDPQKVQDIIDQTKKEDIIEDESIESDDTLKKVIHQMLIDTKNVANCTLDNGFSIQDNDEFLAQLSTYIDEIISEDPINAICIDTFGFSQNGSNVEILLDYSIPNAELVTMKQETVNLANQAFAQINIAGKSDLEIVMAVNEYLCDKVEYPDQDMRKYPNTQGYAPESHTAYSAFKFGSAVCDGYARAAQILLSKFKVDSMQITGICTDGVGHAWNLAKVDDAWYHLDVCWDDGSGNLTEYMLKADPFMKQSREWDDCSWYPSRASADYNIP